ncbi:MAG: 30S ribosomal protein S20 [Candidatus Uhrbacteria bacterium]
MPNKANAWKALRQSKRHAVRNKGVRDGVTFLRRKLKRSLESGDAAQAGAAFKDVQKALDRAAEKGVMKDNTVSRLKSRAVTKLQKM